MQITGVVVIKNQTLQTRMKKLLEGAKTFAASAGVVYILNSADEEVADVFNQMKVEAVPVMVKPQQKTVAESFRATGLPVLYDIGKVIFWCSSVYGFYYIIRKNIKEGSARVKWAAIGYILLRCLETFTRLVDNIATSLANSG